MVKTHSQLWRPILPVMLLGLASISFAAEANSTALLRALAISSSRQQPGVRVELHGNTNDVNALSALQLVVTGETSRFKAQTFPLAEIASDLVLESVDVNFDGYQDFRVLVALGATGNRSYRYWLFHPVKGQFEVSPALDDLNITEIDAKTKTLSGSWNGGADSRMYSVYHWEAGKCLRVLERQLGTAREFRSQPECQGLLLGYQDAELVEITRTFRRERLTEIACERWLRTDE